MIARPLSCFSANNEVLFLDTNLDCCNSALSILEMMKPNARELSMALTEVVDGAKVLSEALKEKSTVEHPQTIWQFGKWSRRGMTDLEVDPA